ncbi:hypothetical protein IG197_27515 [Aminobacter sp. SR38]|jgi:hypothetical protein|uniref:hypothetical protein n=1 Tax=Aminobacter sp. SR38 TaxID=2774562 RepID=UPI00177EDB09|nr:hypothetical protein [Aminobacter sp. SR38]QOF71448.1 hypothetical protein IG197_27515 [Aminobacter sp. SR38]
MSRPSSDKQRASLKMAFARAVETLGGGKIVSSFTRVNAAMISLYAAPHEDQRQAGLDVAFDIDKAHADAGAEPPILSTYATLLGYSLAALEPSSDASGVTLSDMARLDREAFEARATIYDSLADGQFTPAEKRKALKELADLEAVIAAIKAKVEAA